MDTTAQIEKFLRDIRRRNRREIILGILAIAFVIGMMLMFVLFTDSAPVGSLTFLGFLLMILAMLFNVGMMWFVAAPRGDLSSHPASNGDHWATEMLRQAKLLRLVSIWGVAPFAPSLALLLWPKGEVDPQAVLAYSIKISLVLLLFGVVVWLNLRGASQLEQQAMALKEA